MSDIRDDLRRVLAENGISGSGSRPMPVHEAADCRSQNCHAHHGPLVPRDVPAPGNGVEYPPHEVIR